MLKKPKKPKSTPTFVVELPLLPDPSDARRLGGILDAAKRLNNVMLQDGLGLAERMRADLAWDAARKLSGKTPELKAARQEAFSAVRKAHGFSEYAFHEMVKRHRADAGFADRVGSAVAQKIATKVYQALNEYVCGGKGRPRFKGVQRPLHSIEGKSQDGCHLVFDKNSECLFMSPTWAIPTKLPDLAKDEWFWSALQAPIKYCRLTWRNVGDARKYYVQLVLEGCTPMKVSLAARLAQPGAKGALDIGPSNIAWVSETDAGLFKFCAEVDAPQKFIKRLQRQVERQRRANNPDNFDDKGRAKRGCKWVKSNTQQGVEQRLRTAHSHTAECRTNAHGRDINYLLTQARHFRHDGVSVKSLQKNYGRSIGARAPGRFMSELARKAERAGAASTSVNVRQLKTSQYDHSTGAFVKKPLSQRWHVFADGRGQCQRDVYSAFLALHASQSIDEDGVVSWSYEPKQMQTAWLALEPVLRAKGLFKPTETVSTRERQLSAGPVSPAKVTCAQDQATKPRVVGPRPGIRARGDAHFETFPRAAGLNRLSKAPAGPAQPAPRQ